MCSGAAVAGWQGQTQRYSLLHAVGATPGGLRNCQQRRILTAHMECFLTARLVAEHQGAPLAIVIINALLADLHINRARQVSSLLRAFTCGDAAGGAYMAAGVFQGGDFFARLVQEHHSGDAGEHTPWSAAGRRVMSAPQLQAKSTPSRKEQKRQGHVLFRGHTVGAENAIAHVVYQWLHALRKKGERQLPECQSCLPHWMSPHHVTRVALQGKLSQTTGCCCQQRHPRLLLE